MPKDKEAENPERPLEPEEKDKLRAETAKLLAEQREAEAKARTAEIELAKAEEIYRREKLADDFKHRRYHFDEAVGSQSVNKCMKQLEIWHREDPKAALDLVFSSPGGSVIDGMELFDYVTALRKTHKVTTYAYGMAASMAGILLQSGDVRVCGPQAYILIHEVSFGASGKFGEVEDEVKFVKKIQGRVLDIFAERCKNANSRTATKKLTRATIARRGN
jgi:ATP-dependent Clp endopeptidase proteolytic subunit ClpP